MRVALAATFLGAVGGGLADLRWSGRGLAAMMLSGLAGFASMRIALGTTSAPEPEMWAAMAGMAGGGLGGLAGAAAAGTLAAVVGFAHPHAMDWSMLLMGGGMGGMLGPTIGGAIPRPRAHARPGPRVVTWRSRRGA